MEVELAEVRDFLARCAPFDELPAARLDQLPGLLTQRYHRRGTHIVEAGAENHRLRLVRSGAVEVCDPDGALLDTRDVGDCFGYSTLTHSGPSRYLILAAEDTLVLEMTREVFDDLAAEFPAVRSFFGRRSDRIREDLASARLHASAGDPLGTPVRDLLTRDAVTAPPTSTVRDAARLMTERRVSSLLVVDAGVVVGILTDRDIRTKVVAEGLDTGETVAAAMTRSPVTVDAGARAFDATLTLIEHRVHHLPVVDDDAPVGLVTSADLLRLAQADPVYLAARISRAPDADSVARHAERLRPLVTDFVRRRTAPHDIGRVITATADAATRRLLALAEEELGPPPVGYCWVVLGSQARGEAGAASDQDSALILADAARGAAAVDAYFADLAGRVCEGLARSGFPPCPGDMMATNPLWRRTCSQWRRQVADWVGAPDEEALLHAQTFFDIRPVHGDAALYRSVHEQILDRASGSPRFLAHLARIACDWHPPLGFLRGLVVERRGQYRNTLDIKAGGIVPLVQSARVHALSAGLPALSTRARLDAAAGAGVLGRSDADELAAAFRIVRDLAYRHHARQLADDVPRDNHLDPSSLGPGDRHRLRAAFRIISRAQKSLALRYRVGQM